MHYYYYAGDAADAADAGYCCGKYTLNLPQFKSTAGSCRGETGKTSTFVKVNDVSLTWA